MVLHLLGPLDTKINRESKYVLIQDKTGTEFKD